MPDSKPIQNFVLAIACTAMLGMVACGGGAATQVAQPRDAVTSAPDTELSNAEEELAELFQMSPDDYEREMDRRAENQETGPSSGLEPAQPAPPMAPPPEPSDQHSAADSPRPAVAQRSDDSDDFASDQLERCQRACRALAAVERAGTRVCEIAGDDSSRCQRTRLRVRFAKWLVWARCPMCALSD